MSTPTNNWSR